MTDDDHADAYAEQHGALQIYYRVMKKLNYSNQMLEYRSQAYNRQHNSDDFGRNEAG